MGAQLEDDGAQLGVQFLEREYLVQWHEGSVTENGRCEWQQRPPSTFRSKEEGHDSRSSPCRLAWCACVCVCVCGRMALCTPSRPILRASGLRTIVSQLSLSLGVAQVSLYEGSGGLLLALGWRL